MSTEAPPASSEKAPECSSSNAEEKPAPAPAPAPASCDEVKDKVKEPDHDIHLKPEYILNERHPYLAPLPERRSKSDRDAEPNQQQKKNRHKKNVKDSKRARDETETLSDTKVCKQFMVGKVCPFGDACIYSHDMKEMISMREDDIKEIEGGCPHFNLKGQCPYGLACRVGSCHLNLSTGTNLTKEVDAAVKDEETVKNHISFDVLTLLRKNQYKFSCNRYQNKKNRNAEKEAEAAVAVAVAVAEKDEQHEAKDDTNMATDEKTEPVDMTPLPKIQMRKLIDFRNKVYVAPLT